MNWEFVLFPNADSTNYINDIQLELPPHSVIAISSSAIHRIECPDPNHYHIDIYISDESLKSLCATLFSKELYLYLCDHSHSFYTFTKQEFNYISKRLVGISNFQISETSRATLVKALLIQILSYFYQQMNPEIVNPPEWLSEFTEKLQDPTVFCLPLDEIRKLSLYSKSRLSHLFKEYYNCTLFDYVTALKLKYAKNLLKYTQKSILEITTLLGYESISSFIHAFKRYTNITPSKYRQEHLEQSAIPEGIPSDSEK